MLAWLVVISTSSFVVCLIETLKGDWSKSSYAVAEDLYHPPEAIV